MKIRSETVELLLRLEFLGTAFTIKEAAHHAGQREESMRNTLHRYAEAGLLNCYRKTVNIEHKTGPKNIHFFTLTSDARDLLHREAGVDIKPRIPKRLLNSVFALAT